MSLFKKTIEVYDGNWSSHYICPFGAALCYIAVILCFVLQPIFIYKQIDVLLHQPILYGALLFVIGSFVGKTVTSHNNGYTASQDKPAPPKSEQCSDFV